MHRDVSPFVLSCEAVLMYFCTNVDITFQKCIWCCISVLCNLYYLYWSIRALNQVDHGLNCTESAHKVTQVSWGLISLLNHWKCLVSSKLLFPSQVLHLNFSLCLFSVLKKQFWRRKQLSSTLQLYCNKFYVKIY